MPGLLRIAKLAADRTPNYLTSDTLPPAPVATATGRSSTPGPLSGRGQPTVEGVCSFAYLPSLLRGERAPRHRTRRRYNREKKRRFSSKGLGWHGGGGRRGRGAGSQTTARQRRQGAEASSAGRRQPEGEWAIDVRKEGAAQVVAPLALLVKHVQALYGGDTRRASPLLGIFVEGCDTQYIAHVRIQRTHSRARASKRLRSGGRAVV